MTERDLRDIERALEADLPSIAQSLGNVTWPLATMRGVEWPVEVRLQVEVEDGELGEWEVWTGGADYDTDHSGHWGASEVGYKASLSDLMEVARELVDQVLEDLAACYL